MAAGRPLKFKSVKELEKKIQDYFNSCFEDKWYDEVLRDPDTGQYVLDEKNKRMYQPVKKRVQIKPITITGLAVYLDTSRETLCNYEEKEEYFDTIKRAKAFIENMLEDGMLSGTIAPAAAIFNAKNNFGWKDKQELEHEGNVNINISSFGNKDTL